MLATDGLVIGLAALLYRAHRFEVERRGQLAHAEAERLRLSAALDSCEAAVRAAEQAERQRSPFLADISHEIRTPLNAILGLTRLLRRDERNPAQAQRLEKLDAAGHHLLAIIDNCLEMSSHGARLKLAADDFGLDQLLDDVRSAIAPHAAAKGLALEVDGGAVPPSLNGDATRLRHCLLNYARNAVKFTPAGTIRLCAELAGEDATGLLIRFSVVDTGIGIAQDRLDRLFAELEQAGAARLAPGGGLGLLITERLAQMMGGQAGASSVPGQGSHFWFTARLQRGRDVTPARGRNDGADPGTVLRGRHAGVRLLLAEDNPVNTEVALELLRAVGIEVTVAPDGSAAVESARDGNFDVILMDVQMPKLDGLAATRAIRDLDGYRHTPVVALSANAFDEDRSACLAAGMNAFVAKPVNPDVLYGALLSALSGRAGERC